MNSTEYLYIRVKPSFKEEILKTAKNQNLDTSKFIRKLLEKELAAQCA